MGMTRATGGPVRCPWCSRPVSDGPGSPETCPSCGVPLSPALVRSRDQVPAPPGRGVRARRSQRLRAIATVLALTAVMLIISAIGVIAAVLRENGSDHTAKVSLTNVATQAYDIRRDSSFLAATPAVLAKAADVGVVDAQTPSVNDHQVSSAVSGDGLSWYGAVKSGSGRCFAAALVNGDPKQLVTLLPGNCTGDAARASLMPLPSAPPPAPSMTAGPATAPGAGSSAPAPGS